MSTTPISQQIGKQFTITGVELDIYHENLPDTGDPDTVIPLSEIKHINFDSRAESVKDEATITVNHPGRVTDPSLLDYDLRVGDRIDWVIQFAEVTQTGPNYGEEGYGEGDYGGETTGPGYGAGGYGVAEYGGDESAITWTGRVLSVDRDRDHVGKGGAFISADATDFVAGVLGERKITGAYVGQDVGAIIRDVVTTTTSEVSATEADVPNLGITTDVFYQNRDVWDAIAELAARGDAILLQSGTRLLLRPITTLPAPKALIPGDYQLPWKTTTGSDIKNIVRVDSGVTGSEEASQPTQSTTAFVDDTTRITHQIRARKSEVHSVDLYVDKVSDEDDLLVRLQADQGGAPIAVGDPDSDITRARWDADNLPDTPGTKRFFFPSHTLADRDPWMIIEASGAGGHNVGTDGAGAPTYTTYYPHPISFEVTNTESINEFGAREIRLEKENLQTLSATQDAALAELARQAFPPELVSIPARSTKAHLLSPGDRVTLDEPSENAVGEYIVVEMSRSFDAGTVAVDTTITAASRRGLLADVS